MRGNGRERGVRMMERSLSGTGFPPIFEKSSSRTLVRGWLALALFMGGLAVVLSIFFVWLRVQQIQDGYRLAKIEEEYGVLTSVQRKLHLEWNRLQDPYFLEQLAKERFGMNPPRKDQRLQLH
jgi:hypothetical protein